MDTTIRLPEYERLAWSDGTGLCRFGADGPRLTGTVEQIRLARQRERDRAAARGGRFDPSSGPDTPLARLRRAKRLSQGKAAAAAGIEQAHLSVLERTTPRGVRADTVLKIARGWGYPVEEVMAALGMGA